jgi:hypothetical protein
VKHELAGAVGWTGRITTGAAVVTDGGARQQDAGSALWRASGPERVIRARMAKEELVAGFVRSRGRGESGSVSVGMG